MFSPYPADNNSQLGVILDCGLDGLLSEQSNGMKNKSNSQRRVYYNNGIRTTEESDVGLQTISLSAVLIGLIRIDNSEQTTLRNVYRLENGNCSRN